MSYLLAILGLAAVCILWFVLQRASGDPEGLRSGTCGACTGKGECKRDASNPGCHSAKAVDPT